jgi:hypothetical protein
VTKVTDPEQLFREASQRALQLDVPRALEDAAIERVRLECATYFDRIPEPPIYRRAQDPSRAGAEALLPAGKELLARLLALQRDEAAAPRLSPLAEALRLHLAALCHVSAGRLEAAESAWLEAIEREGAASASRRAWARSDERRTPVYDRTTGLSRFDPSPEPQLQVKLVCPWNDCQKSEQYGLAPTYATHRFRCASCRRAFIGYFGEARGVEITRLHGDAKRYLFRVQELNSGMAQVVFEDSSGGDFVVARRDLLAFLYTPDRELKAVLNLSSSRLLWVQRNGWCFVATAAFGEGAAELDAFRAFRDRVLARAGPGRAAIRVYYRHGPAAARWLRRHPRARARVRAGLSRMHRLLVRSGF